MPSHTLHVVQAFEERDGGIVPVEPKACPSAASARALAARLAQTHVGVIAWSRTGNPDLGDWGPPEILVRTGVIPDEFEAGGGVTNGLLSWAKRPQLAKADMRALTRAAGFDPEPT